MIVAIVPAGLGTNPVAAFVEAESAASGVSRYCGMFSPPLEPEDFVGFETGWLGYQPPGAGQEWTFTYDPPSLGLTDLPPYTNPDSDEDPGEFFGTPVDLYNFKSFTTQPLDSGPCEIFVSCRCRVDKSHVQGQLLVLLDEDPEKVLLSTAVSGTGWLQYSDLTEQNFVSPGTHTISFYFSSSFRKSSIYAESPRYKIRRD